MRTPQRPMPPTSRPSRGLEGMVSGARRFAPHGWHGQDFLNEERGIFFASAPIPRGDLLTAFGPKPAPQLFVRQQAHDLSWKGSFIADRRLQRAAWVGDPQRRKVEGHRRQTARERLGGGHAAVVVDARMQEHTRTLQQRVFLRPFEEPDPRNGVLDAECAGELAQAPLVGRLADTDDGQFRTGQVGQNELPDLQEAFAAFLRMQAPDKGRIVERRPFVRAYVIEVDDAVHRVHALARVAPLDKLLGVDIVSDHVAVRGQRRGKNGKELVWIEGGKARVETAEKLVAIVTLVSVRWMRHEQIQAADPT